MIGCNQVYGRHSAGCPTVGSVQWEQLCEKLVFYFSVKVSHKKKKKSFSPVRLCNPMDYIVHGILQVRILEWVAFPLLQGIFPTQGSNPGLPHCWWILSTEQTINSGILFPYDTYQKTRLPPCGRNTLAYFC